MQVAVHMDYMVNMDCMVRVLNMVMGRSTAMVVDMVKRMDFHMVRMGLDMVVVALDKYHLDDH